MGNFDIDPIIRAAATPDYGSELLLGAVDVGAAGVSTGQDSPLLWGARSYKNGLGMNFPRQSQPDTVGQNEATPATHDDNRQGEQ